MLVLAVMAVVAGFVLPNLFRPASAALDDTARHTVRLLHLAAEEAQLRGMPLRWNAYADHYVFELAAEGGEWQALSEPPFEARTLPEGISISEVKLAEGVQFFMAGLSDSASQGNGTAGGEAQAARVEGKKPPLGTVVFMSDGMLSVADVSLHAEEGDVLIELRPGPAGIRVVEAAP